MSQEAQTRIRMQYLGVLALLTQMSTKLDPERGEENEETRATIERALADAQTVIPNLRWSRAHTSFTVWIAA